MSKPILYDLYSGAGGASRGYQIAGFEVWGVDNRPQPRYCGKRFIQMDAFEFLERVQAGEYPAPAAIHASPPCQAYIRGGLVKRGRHPNLLPATREALIAAQCPWVLENVPGAPMRPDVTLCGSMFGLEVRRHRWFESNVPMPMLVPPCDHSYPVTGVYGGMHGQRGAWPGMLPGDMATWSRAMGIDWMTASEITQAIPPAYTTFIGAALMQAIQEAAA